MKSFAAVLAGFRLLLDFLGFVPMEAWLMAGMNGEAVVAMPAPSACRRFNFFEDMDLSCLDCVWMGARTYDR